MCLHSNSLYNSGMWIVNNYFKETNKYIGYNQLYKEIKDNVHYTSIPAKIAQQTLRLLDKDFRSFFALLNRKKKGEYQSKIKLPKYKKPNSEFILILPSDQVALKNNVLKITKEVKLKFTYEIKGKIKQLIIKPNGFKSYTMFLQYEEEKNKTNKKDEKRFLSIDLGIDNLATCVSNVGPSFIMTGKPLKAYNQLYNKRKAKIQSILEKCNSKKWSNKLMKINIDRSNWINTYFDQSISKIFKYCGKYEIGTIIIGYNEGWKQETNLGKVTNQKFISIPHFLFKKKIENKCTSNDIKFIRQEESYTSKCSFIDGEAMNKKDIYIGKRIKRGLFISKEGILLNADVNGACNIGRKVFPKFKYNGIEAFIVGPKVLSPFIGGNL